MTSSVASRDGSHSFSTRSTLLVCILLLATIVTLFSQSQASASEVFPTRGTWKGTVSGTGTILKKYPINLTGTMEGSFDGSTQGSWRGLYIATYKISQVSTGTVTEQEIGEIKGNCTWSIDSSGTIIGEARVKLTGPLEGELKMTLQGSKSASGDLKGTYAGDLTRDTFSYGGTPVAADFSAKVAGEFEGRETTTPVESPTPTASTPTSPTATPTRTPSTTQDSTQQMQYGMVAVIVIAIIAGGYLFLKRRARHK